MADANIFQQYLRPVRSVAEYSADYDKQEANALELAALRQKTADATRAAADDMAARAAYQQAAGDPKAYRNALVRAGNYRAVQALDDAELKRSQSVAETGLKTAQTGKANADTAETHQKLFKDSLGAVVANPTPETVNAVLSQLESTTGRPSAQARQIFATAKTPEDIRSIAMRIGLSLEKQLPSNGNVDLGGSRAFTSTDPITGRVTITSQAPITQSADNAATNATARRGQDMTDRRAQENNALQRDAQRTQIITDPNLGVLAVDKGSGTYKPVTGAGGAAIPGENKVAAQKQANQLGAAIQQARELIPKATNSGAGAMVDRGAAFVGASTPGADAAAQLDTLAGWMISNVPRMQGPQSDKDIMLYSQMAARVGDRNVPASQRLKALDTLETLQRKYAEAGGFGPPSAGQSAPASGGKVVDFGSLK